MNSIHSIFVVDYLAYAIKNVRVNQTFIANWRHITFWFVTFPVDLIYFVYAAIILPIYAIMVVRFLVIRHRKAYNGLNHNSRCFSFSNLLSENKQFAKAASFAREKLR